MDRGGKVGRTNGRTEGREGGRGIQVNEGYANCLLYQVYLRGRSAVFSVRSVHLWEEGGGGGGWLDFVVIEEFLHLTHEDQCLLSLALDRLQDGCVTAKGHRQGKFE